MLNDIHLSQTVEVFLTRLATELELDSIVIKKGFPPKPVSLDDKNKALADIGIRNKDTLIVEGTAAVIVT